MIYLFLGIGVLSLAVPCARFAVPENLRVSAIIAFFLKGIKLPQLLPSVVLAKFIAKNLAYQLRTVRNYSP